MGNGPSQQQQRQQGEACFAFFGGKSRSDALLPPEPSPYVATQSPEMKQAVLAAEQRGLRESEAVTRQDQLTLAAQKGRIVVTVNAVTGAQETLTRLVAHRRKRCEELRREAASLARQGLRTEGAAKLRESKLHQASAIKLDAVSFKLQCVRINVEDAQITFEAIVPLKDAAQAMGASLKTLDVDKIDELLALLEEQIGDATQISKLLGDPTRLGDPELENPLASEELDAELDQLVQQYPEQAAPPPPQRQQERIDANANSNFHLELPSVPYVQPRNRDELHQMSPEQLAHLLPPRAPRGFVVSTLLPQ